MSFHPLVQRLIDEAGGTAVTLESLAAWSQRPGDHALLFGGDPVRFPEVLDVAVVLPELRAASGGRFDIGVATRENEDALARRFGVQRWPSIVFLREGGYVATVSGMLDWGDYVAAVGQALAAPVGRAPTVGIPVRSADEASACH